MLYNGIKWFEGIETTVELNVFKKLMDENDNRLPFLTLDEFFEGNTAEDSIAPNQWGQGRPFIAEIWKLMRELEKIPSVAWIRVELHDDTEIAKYDGKEVLVLTENSDLQLAVDIFQAAAWLHATERKFIIYSEDSHLPTTIKYPAVSKISLLYIVGNEISNL